MTPALSIIIPTHDRRRELGRTLGLLAAQRLPPHEILVADNASSDGTAEMLARRFPRARLLRLPANLGAAARNVAAREARAPMLLMLDDDSAPEPGSAARGLKILARDKKLAAAGFRVLLAGGVHEAGGTHNVFVGCGALLRREAFLAAGGFPGDFRYYVEEYALCYRLFALGLRVRVFGDLVVRHRRSAFSARRAEVFALLARNNLKLAARFLPPELARRRSRELVDWYLNLARLSGVRSEVAAAVRRTRAELRGGPPSTEALSGRALSAATSAEALARGLAALRAEGVRRLGLWRYTKDARTFVEACCAAGIEVAELATDMLEGASFAGTRLVRPENARRDLPWLVPTFSPGLAEIALAELGRAGLSGRALFKYE